MKKVLALATGVTMGLSLATAQAADTVTIQLKWVAQAQFAGYFVAKERASTRKPGSTSPSSQVVRTSLRHR